MNNYTVFSWKTLNGNVTLLPVTRFNFAFIPESS